MGAIHVETTYSNSATTSTANTNTTLANRLGNMLLNNFLPANNTNLVAYTDTYTSTSSSISRLNVSSASHTHSYNIGSSSSSSTSTSNSISDNTPTLTFPTFRPPSIENLVASSAEDLSNFRDVSFDIFDDNDDLFGSPLAFGASENGLWNGGFVPPPPRPPFFVDEPVWSDGLTRCDLCTWAMPTKSTFIFVGTIEKASELVSALSALLCAIIMVTVVRCRRKKPTNNRNETHVQWWSRHKRSNGNNNNHLRRSNYIYTAHPADSIRGLQQPSLSAASSLTTMIAMGASAAPLHSAAVTPNSVQLPQLPIQLQQQQNHKQQQQYYHHPYHHNSYQPPLYRSHSGGHQRTPDYEYEHEYHQPQELQLQLQHERQNRFSMSSISDSPTLPMTNSLNTTRQMHMHQPQQQEHQLGTVTDGVTVGFGCMIGGGVGTGVSTLGVTRRVVTSNDVSDDSTCRWPNATIVVAS
ncbi:LOW QUALITY PROTEIN: uncharacterized protein [Eurosta solidaginis]|uniref:LOW QUALITY PROTEIN: uncharacterized protein n=1 Tax=Eurosta solidaginis TaxID=178769 RepID=UPI0035314E89